MDKLSFYNSLDEVEQNFDVIKYVNNESDFHELISEVDKNKDKDIVLYRGVSSPTYKMYSSSQRFYCENKKDLKVDNYEDFLSRLYQISTKIDEGRIEQLYDSLKKDNNIKNSKDEDYSQCTQLPYNPVFAFHALQHYAECSPFLDFTSEFHVALYFAAMKISVGDFIKSQFRYEEEMDDYIEIISFCEDKDLFNIFELTPNVYGSLYTNIIESNNLDSDSLKTKIETEFFDFYLKQKNKIRYVSSEGISKVLIGGGLDYKYSFQNANSLAQSGRLFLNATEDEPFEDLWNKAFNSKRELRVYLIHKSLVFEILKYITKCLFEKIVPIPVQKGYKEEIIQLISLQNN